MHASFQAVPAYSVKPAGWLHTRLQQDIAGFVGKLDELVPALMQDDIYGKNRLRKDSPTPQLGNLKQGDAHGNEQYKWWNSETQSNWWDAYIHHVFLLQDSAGIEKVQQYIKRILATQDEDGYLGIYDAELRYKFTTENGELWSKTTLYRGLLAYYAYTQDQTVWHALMRAVDNVMENYPINASKPFESGKKFNGGVSHGLTFTDVLDKMFQYTGERKYLDYAIFLYDNFSATHQSEADAQLHNILNPAYRLQAHGVHTFEHLRPLAMASWASGRQDLQDALAIYVARIQEATTLAGGAIGDEWIAGRQADATHTGYEYCALHELVDSYSVLLQKTGKTAIADQIERVFYNASQGARHPEKSCLAYLKTDNSFEMLGTRNGTIEPNRKQTRYKYSPAHQDVAVCCAPNAGRITPYFIRNMWLKEGENTLVASLLGASVLETCLQDTPIRIEVSTHYPYEDSFIFKIDIPEPLAFTLKIRKPAWAISTNSPYRHGARKWKKEGDFTLISRTFQPNEEIQLYFTTKVRIEKDAQGKHYFMYGALVFARPIEATEKVGKEYAQGFEDLYYEPNDSTQYEYVENHKAKYKNGKITAFLKNKTTQSIEKVQLVPIGKTILRQASF